jgi:putative flippase GtrA
MKHGITSVIDFFYPPFRKLMPLQTFRYAACGGANMVVGFFVFTAVFHFVLHQLEVNCGIVSFKVAYSKIQGADVLMMDFGFFAFKAHSFALFCSTVTAFILGFLLNKYVVFTASNLRGRIQFFRYFLASLSSFCINYFLLNALVLYLHVYPVLAQVIVTAIVVTISFFMQQYFSFKVKEEVA